VHQPFNESLQFIMDTDLFKRFGCAGIRPRHIAQSLAVFRAHAAAKTSTLGQVGYAENEAWIKAQSWPTRWLWLLSRVVDRFRRFFRS
jgi:hypothetical protein